MNQEPTPPAANTTKTDDDKPSGAKRLFKGCGCVTAVVVLALGILIIGNFDAAAWASALIAIIIAVLVFNLSGVNGFWES